MRTVEEPDTKKALIRVSFPAEQIATARELGKPEHFTVSQICRRALDKEIEVMRQKQSQKAWKQKQQRARGK
jgi:hypothetical protein